MNAIASSPPRLNTSDAVNYLLTQHGIRVAENDHEDMGLARRWPRVSEKRPAPALYP